MRRCLILLRRLGAAAVLPRSTASAIGVIDQANGPFGGFEAICPELYRFTRHGRAAFLSPSKTSYCNDFDSVHATRSSTTAEVVLTSLSSVRSDTQGPTSQFGRRYTHRTQGKPAGGVRSARHSPRTHRDILRRSCGVKLLF